MFVYSEKINNWFRKIPSEFNIKKSIDKEIVFQFRIFHSGSKNVDNALIRTISIAGDSCTISEYEVKNADVIISIDEMHLVDIITGELSFYDAFLSSQVDIKGKMKYASELMDFFTVCIFPNRELKFLSVENVFNKINDMVDRIPKKLFGKNIQIKVTGRNAGNYFFKIDESSVNMVSFDELKNVIHAKMTIPEEVLLEMFCDEIEMMEAYEDGQITFTGENQIGVEFDRMFDYRFKRYHNA